VQTFGVLKRNALSPRVERTDTVKICGTDLCQNFQHKALAMELSIRARAETASPPPGCMDTTTACILHWVGLQTNASKTKVMIAVPRRLISRELDSVHKRRIQCGDSHRERQRRRVECSECGLSLSLVRHR
jgi:hypothetical protein